MKCIYKGRRYFGFHLAAVTLNSPLTYSMNWKYFAMIALIIIKICNAAQFLSNDNFISTSKSFKTRQEAYKER